jgi:hypothetical protein
VPDTESMIYIVYGDGREHQEGSAGPPAEIVWMGPTRFAHPIADALSSNPALSDFFLPDEPTEGANLSDAAKEEIALERLSWAIYIEDPGEIPRHRRCTRARIQSRLNGPDPQPGAPAIERLAFEASVWAEFCEERFAKAERGQRGQPGGPRKTSKPRPLREAPTPRQMEAYALSLKRKPLSEIARELGVSKSRAGALVQEAKAIMERKGRSVRAGRLPCDRRGQN